jgi:hypothetical protein
MDIYDAAELTIESAERMNKYNGEEKLCRFETFKLLHYVSNSEETAGCA